MFTHINECLNRVGYLHLHILFLLVRTMLNYMTVSCVYIIYVCAHASSASRPPTGRTIHTSPSLALTNGSAFGELFGIAELTRLQLPKCNNHLVSFINVDGLSVSYIVHIFDTIKSRTMVYRSMECPHF